MVQMNRRSFIGQAAMSSAAAGMVIHGFYPPAAEAQFTTFLSYLIGDNPILAVVFLIEQAIKPSLQPNAPTMTDIVASINGVAQNLRTNFEDLQRHFHSMLVDALDEFALKQDTIELAALAYRMNIAVAGGSKESDIRNLSGSIDDVAVKLGNRGVAGSLSYLNAIALQNSVHKMLGSVPQVILAVNSFHDKKLGEIIYNGKISGTLETAIQQKRSEMNSSPYWQNLRLLKQKIGESYTLGTVTRYYESGAVSTCDLIFRYDGFQGGEPVGSRWYGLETFSPGANNYRGRLIRATYTPFNKNDAYPLAVDFNSRLAFPEAWPSGVALVGQINGIVGDYKKFYNSLYGPEISSRTITEFWMTSEQAALKTYLIETGLDSVKRILKVASAPQA